MIYLIGSLRNRKVTEIAIRLQEELNEEVFADWTCPGPHADDFLRDYIRQRGGGYREALNSYAARHIFDFDKQHLDRCDRAVLVMPAGKSCFSELGYIVGQGKKGYVLMDKEPKRYDIMFQFYTVCFSIEELIERIKEDDKPFEITQEEYDEWAIDVINNSPYLTDIVTKMVIDKLGETNEVISNNS